MKRLAIIEIVLGLALVALSGYFMLESVYFPQGDRHGFILAAAIFGSSLGALLAFAGAVLHSSARYGVLAHVPFAAYFVATYITWFGAYA
jgi:hypothetical protein